MSGGTPPDNHFGSRGQGLHASLAAAISYDEVCCGHGITVSIEPQAIVLSGRAPPIAAKRAREIVVEIAGHVPVWDRTFWL